MSIETELASLKTAFEERTNAIQGDINQIKEHLENINDRLHELPCKEYATRTKFLENKVNEILKDKTKYNGQVIKLNEDIKNIKDDKFVARSVKFLWGVVVLLWSAVVSLFLLLVKKNG